MAYILNKAQILCRPAFLKNIISSPINKRLKSYKHFSNRTNVWTEKKYKLKDNISDDYRLVYREHSSFNMMIAVAYHVGWMGIVAGTLSTGYLIFMKPPVYEKKGMEGVLIKEYEGIVEPLTNVGRVLMLCASFAISTLLIVCSKTIPFRIYYNSAEKVYKGVFVHRIFGKKQIETFGEGTVIPVFSRKSLGHIFFNMNGRIVILDKECFPVPSIREQMICKTE